MYRSIAATAFAAITSVATLAQPALAQEKVLRAVMHADVRTLDPMWTTQTIANIHGMLIYDTLFGNDADMVPKPQMVEKYTISEDRLQYRFTLRPGLRFHDGSPVTTKDVIASLKRWGARDGAGQRLLSFVASMTPDDENTFTMVMKEPYGMVLETLGKTGSSVAVVMREKEALTDPQQQVTETIGSGPYKFAKEQWVPGSKAVYLKNKDYVPRPGNEPASSFAGSKYPGVDKIELLWISDPQTAMSALINGEIDYYENPNIDHIPILEKAKNVKLQKTGKLDSTQGMIRLNHLHPPFNNVKARQAIIHLVNQEDYLRAVIGNPAYYRVCHGMLTCGATMANDGGSKLLADYDPKKTLKLMKEAGYNNEPIVVLATTDHNTITPATQVLIQSMRDAGLNVDAQAMDWGTTVSRRAKKEPVAQGGWNIFITGTGGVTSSDPVLHTWMGGACDKGLFGWPCDAEIEKLRNTYAFADTLEKRKQIARDLQARAVEQVVYIPIGQWTTPIAYRSDRLDNVVTNTGLAILWNITKK
jgi:peptide/nickel transport system substrate-binding protein